MKQLLLIFFIVAIAGSASAKCSDLLVETTTGICCYDITLNHTESVWKVSNHCHGLHYYFVGDMCCIREDLIELNPTVRITTQNGKTYRLTEYINPFDGKVEKSEAKEMKGSIIAPYLPPTTTTLVKKQIAPTTIPEPIGSSLPTIPPIVSVLAIITIIVFAAVWLLGGRGNEEDSDTDDSATDSPS